MQLDAVDTIDRKIIDQLRSDGRRSFGEIGRYVGLSEASVRQRYRRLLSLGVVQVVGVPNVPRLDYHEAHLVVRVKGAPVENVARAFAAFPEVKYVSTCIGAFDITVDLQCTRQEDLTRFLTDTMWRVRGVDSAETVRVLEVVKDEYAWAGFREPVNRATRPHPAIDSR